MKIEVFDIATLKIHIYTRSAMITSIININNPPNRFHY